MSRRVWYKNWIWYYHFILFAVFLSFLIWGLYLCSFVEYWYHSRSTFFNFDILMSFLSVQVNIMTIVWLIFYLLNFNKRKYGISGDRFRMPIMNWNLIVFIIFWAGIIFIFKTDATFLSNYSKNQIWCTVVTHFLAPLSLIIVYWFAMGGEKFGYLNTWKKWDIYISILYPFCYLFYIYFRAKMYAKDNLYVGAWPYPFLDFDDLFVGDSVVGYMFLLIFTFAIWILAHHYFLIYINNLSYRFRNRKKFKTKISNKINKSPKKMDIANIKEREELRN